MQRIGNEFKMIVILLCLSFQIYVVLTQENSCENDIFRCESYLTQSDCPANEFLEIDKSLGCCPTCRGGLSK